MKSLKYILVCATAVLCFAACNDEGSGTGDATVGFEKDSYVFKENAGTVNIPLKFSGEPKKWPIVLNVAASVDGGASIGDVVRFVQQIGSLKYNGKGELSIEMEVIDNYTPNADVTLTLEIMSAEGAEIIGGTTAVTIEDNDASLFESLQGGWNFYAMSASNEPVYFGVYIDAGETSQEIAENTEKQRLRILGFGGYGYSDDEYEIPFAWYMDVITDEVTGEQSLRTVPDIPLITHPGNPFEDEDFTKVTVVMMWTPADDPYNLDPDFEISATVSDDLSTITFDPDVTIVPYIYDNNEPSTLWAQLFDCRMVRQ